MLNRHRFPVVIRCAPDIASILSHVMRAVGIMQDVLYGDGLDTSTSSGPSPGDFLGGGLWAASLYYCRWGQLVLQL